MTEKTFEQDGHLVEKGDTWIIIIKKKNRAFLPPYLNKKIDMKITLKTKD